MSFAVSFIFSENLVSGQGFDYNEHARQLAGAALLADSATKAAADTSSTGPLESIKAGVGKVFSGEATLGASSTSATGAFVGTLIGALAWVGVAYAVVQIIGSLLGVDQSALDAASYAAGNDIYK